MKLYRCVLKFNLSLRIHDTFPMKTTEHETVRPLSVLSHQIDINLKWSGNRNSEENVQGKSVW